MSFLPANFLVFLLLLVLQSEAQLPATGSTIKKWRINAGKIFDSRSGKFIAGQTIFITGDHIDTVKATTAVSQLESSSYMLIDLSKQTLLPGLIDCHTHLLTRQVIWEKNLVPAGDMSRSLLTEGDAYRAVYGAARAKNYLEGGITTVQDLGNSGKFADIALMRAINDGWVPGPRMRCAGQGLSTVGGQMPGIIASHQNLINDEYRVIHNPDDGIDAVRENINQGAGVIKIFSDNTPANTMLRVEEIRAITTEAHRNGVRVTAHATFSQSVYNAVMGGVDGIEHGYQIQDSVLDLMAKRKVFLVPTDGDSVTLGLFMQLYDPAEKMFMEEYRRNMTDVNSRLLRAWRKGVRIAFGSDDYIDYKIPWSEASLRTLIGYVENGIPIAEALKFATINAAEQVNYKGELGVISKGYIADLIAVSPEIERDMHAILTVNFVMKAGRVEYVRN